MARPEILDTTVFIDTIRDPLRWPAFERALCSRRVWLSSVVAAELYAGTRGPDDAAQVDRIVIAMRGVDRLLTPTSGEWARAGRLIGRAVRLRGALRPRDHLADVLIVVSAARLGGVVVSANERHMRPWVRLARAAGLSVRFRRDPSAP